MKKTSEWLVKPSDQNPSQAFQSTPVMAWARNSLTGEPVYVLELDKAHTGAKCGCECPSCELPLIAVNAAKAEYLQRPHFRHPPGAEKKECMYLAARLAALQLLRDQGVLQLPSRKMSGSVVGLSGIQHEAWIEQPTERVLIRSFDFRDRVAAILTLEDGRQLCVQLIGNGIATTLKDEGGYPIPTILLEVDDITVASMSPDELKRRLTLVPDNLCWVSHWNDPELKCKAEEEARRLADELLDLNPADASILDGIDPQFRHETLLHFEIKKILAESREIRVPVLQTKVSRVANNGKKVDCSWERPSELLPIFDVELEKRFGGIIPDVIAKVSVEHGEIMMIEITVTNHIDDKRLIRIREKNVPTLEIDLSHSGGLISRSALKTWVIHDLETKRWIHHPAIHLQTQLLESEADAQVVAIDLQTKTAEIEAAARVAAIEAIALEAKERRRRVLAIPLKDIAQNLLNAVLRYATEYQKLVAGETTHEANINARNDVGTAADNLVIHGYPEATYQELIGMPHGLIPGILSIQLRKGIGYPADSILDVLENIRKLNQDNSNITLYLIAEKAYRVIGDPTHPGWFTYWVDGIKDNIKRNSNTYIRDGNFDSILSLLFPEMAKNLANGYGKALTKTRSDNVSAINGSKNIDKKIQGIRDFYRDGAYRLHCKKIEFDHVLRDAEAIKLGDSYGTWFKIWNEMYGLHGDLKPIARLLDAAGFHRAMDEWQHWDSNFQELKYKQWSRPGEVVANSQQRQTANPAVNRYAMEKGRNEPRG